MGNDLRALESDLTHLCGGQTVVDEQFKFPASVETNSHDFHYESVGMVRRHILDERYRGEPRNITEFICSSGGSLNDSSLRLTFSESFGATLSYLQSERELPKVRGMRTWLVERGYVPKKDGAER